MKGSIRNKTSSISKEVLCRVSRNISISCEACLAGGRHLDSCEIKANFVCDNAKATAAVLRAKTGETLCSTTLHFCEQQIRVLLTGCK